MRHDDLLMNPNKTLNVIFEHVGLDPLDVSNVTEAVIEEL